MLDSLVRVSRRVDENHFANIPNEHLMQPPQCRAQPTTVLCTPDRIAPHERTPKSTLRSSSVQSTVWPRGYNMCKHTTFLQVLSRETNPCWHKHKFRTRRPVVRRKTQGLPTWTYALRKTAVNKPAPNDWFPALPSKQFQVLFNSLFKVLFIFRSRYLFAIGLPFVFSFRWNLPPI